MRYTQYVYLSLILREIPQNRHSGFDAGNETANFYIGTRVRYRLWLLVCKVFSSLIDTTYIYLGSGFISGKLPLTSDLGRIFVEYTYIRSSRGLYDICNYDKNIHHYRNRYLFIQK